MQSLKVADESEWRKFRRVAFEIWRKGTKSHVDEQQYLPIGEVEHIKMTAEELDEIWNKYGKRN